MVKTKNQPLRVSSEKNVYKQFRRGGNDFIFTALYNPQ